MNPRIWGLDFTRCLVGPAVLTTLQICRDRSRQIKLILNSYGFNIRRLSAIVLKMATPVKGTLQKVNALILWIVYIASPWHLYIILIFLDSPVTFTFYTHFENLYLLYKLSVLSTMSSHFLPNISITTCIELLPLYGATLIRTKIPSRSDSDYQWVVLNDCKSMCCSFN